MAGFRPGIEDVDDGDGDDGLCALFFPRFFKGEC